MPGQGKYSIPEFEDLLFKRNISVEEAGIDPTIFAFWRRQGLIDFVAERKWARLSYVQVIWLKVLLTLRDFGVSVAKLKSIHKHFFVLAYKNQLAKRIFEDIKTDLTRKKDEGTINSIENSKLEEILMVLRDRKLLYVYSREITYFSELVRVCLQSGAETGILVFVDGSVAEYFAGRYRYLDENGEYWPLLEKLPFHPPYIFLPIAYFLDEFLSDEALSKYIPELNILTEDEQLVLREMRDKNVSEISITFENGKPKRFDFTRSGTINDKDAAEIREILRIKNYERITLDTRNEKSLSFKRTRKHVRRK